MAANDKLASGPFRTGVGDYIFGQAFALLKSAQSEMSQFVSSKPSMATQVLVQLMKNGVH